jgi:TP901 family phage tail tape measure protein/lambda family phage tail tape measure protein
VSVVANVAINVDSTNAVSKLRQVQTQAQSTEKAFGALQSAIGALGVGFALTKVIADVKELDTNLRRLGTVGVDVAKISPALSKLSDELGGVASKAELAAASYQAASAGFSDTAGNIQILNAATKAAVGGLADTQAVTEVLVKTLNAYGMSGSEAFKVTDSISKAVELGNQEWSDYTSQLGRVVSMAALAGVSLDEMNAFIAAATKNGATAEVAFTGLSSVLTQLLQPTKESKDAAARLNIQWDLMGLKTKGLGGLMKELAVAIDKDKESAARMVGPTEAMRGAFAAASKDGKDFEGILKQLGDASGKTDADFQTMKGSLENTLKALDTSFKNLSEALGKAFGPTLVITIQDITKGVNGFATVMSAVPQPVMNATGELIKFIVQMILVQKAIQSVIALNAGITALFASTASGAAIAGGAAATATPLVNGLALALGRLGALGIITVGVNYVSNVVGEAMSLRQLQERRAKGGAAASFKGATRETVVAAQAAQRKNLAALAKKEKARQDKLKKDNALYQVPIIGPLALAAASPFIAGEQNKLFEQQQFSQGVIGLDPSKFKPATPTVTTTPPPNPTGDKGSNKTADDAKRVAEQIRKSQVQLTLAQDIFAIEGRLQQAQLAGNDQLVLARNAQKELAQIASQRADIIANKEMPALQKRNELGVLAIDAAKVSNKLGFDLAKIEQDRTKSFGEIIADLEFELKLKSATTEEAREQLRLENELRKLKGEGFTPQQISAIAQKKGELAKPQTDAEKVQARINALQTEITQLTNTGNIAIKVADGIGAAFGQAFEGLITGSMTAQEALGNFFKSIGDMFINMATEIIAKQMVMITLGFIMKALGLIGNISSAGNAAGAAAFSPGNAASLDAIPGQAFSLPKLAANGAIFSNGIAKFASGGIVGSPTLFPFANGAAMQMGLMGEAGPEAIMPLQRGADGSLGVRAAMGGNGMGGSSSPVLNMSFETSTINGVEYVSRDQLEAAMAQTRRQASSDGAKRGMAMTLDRIQQSPQTRRRIGM